MELTPAEAINTPTTFIADAGSLTPGNVLIDPDGAAYVVDSVATADGNVTLYLVAPDGWEWDETHEPDIDFVLVSRGDQEAFFKMRNQAACARQNRNHLYAEYIASQMAAASV
ncbi:hypothetical protein ACFVBP_28400 [Nocardioides sp. NPDC057764]|uniref:hypothetical protein n=1 Tax=Nocardioides sp. NPDC057764 TaxID=3346243 RepID=UPI003670A064